MVSGLELRVEGVCQTPHRPTLAYTHDLERKPDAT